jgi:hypothetical protein
VIAGPRRGAWLGSLDASTLEAGDYIAVLDLVAGEIAASVERPFAVVDP